MAPTRAQRIAPTRPSRPWLAFLVGGAIGFAILLVTQGLSDSRIAVGPWALNGNGALAMPFLGFPLAIYAGWTVLVDHHEGRDLTIRIIAFSLGLILGAGPLGLFFALPMVLVTAAVYVTWTRGSSVKRSDLLLWLAFALSVLIGALPILGLFGVSLLPGSLILLARGKPAATRIALGALLVLATVAIVFVVPVLFPAPAPAA
ncbi:MAG: hypothetical protein M3P16_11665 [Chloroflexota bacterium]|nr:hypothetical protein [Chloroflexota bacterium]